ncbi:hypothetical protein N788_02870 [Arenimonas donghaensis DSM 18148 = HO3-R19]|uniref:Uncharacterized protein n=1 Tax=Arenimonas donghaensis DSM 18148 = HO3-R19 TaxID=1121014 RepID=A0A087MI63_9GAMM|nr:hypothetical protein N788_02870 [Arenimonas donghaensis DSM 18148 = HO3-R19]
MQDLFQVRCMTSRDAGAMTTEAFFTMFFSMRVFLRDRGHAAVARTRASAWP